MKNLFNWISDCRTELALGCSLLLILAGMVLSVLVRSPAPVMLVMAPITAGSAILFAFWLGDSLDPFVLEGRLGEWCFCALFICPFLMTCAVGAYSFAIVDGLEALAQYQFEWLSPPRYYQRHDFGQVFTPGLYTGIFSLAVVIVGGICYTIKHERDRFANA
ncbi:hypothetical protein EXS71_02340 [Candidatus Uhrbacteria bacterium]|nr:hypothetical protein [Candidatus Uhrbacteria bacterium]